MPGDSRPTRQKRKELTDQDQRDPSRIVVVDPRGPANFGYSYHQIRDDHKTVYCGGGIIGDEFETMTTAKAQELGKSPRQMCKRILEE